jgi:hypothetical protein
MPAMQLWTPLPEHSVVLGMQTPEHWPLMQVPVAHGIAMLHWPAPSHVCTPLFMHCVCPIVQTPAHPVLVHVWFVHVVSGPQAPSREHTWSEFPTHWLALGEQATQAPFKHTGMEPEQVTMLCQLPVESHDWTIVPAHCVSPGAQVPVHAFAMHVWWVQSVLEAQPGWQVWFASQ